jgi:hypothetical protein
LAAWGGKDSAVDVGSEAGGGTPAALVAAWRVVYRIDTDAIVIVDVFAKKTQKTPHIVIKTCQKRLKEYDDA